MHLSQLGLPALILVSSLALSRAQDAPNQGEIAREALTNSGDRTTSALGASRPTAGTVLKAPDPNGEFGDQVVVRSRAAFDPWRVEVDVQGFFTDNVALAPTEVEDFFLRTGANVRYLNRIASDWTAEFGLGQEFIRYDRFSSLNFDKTNLNVGIATRLSFLGGATALVRYDFDNLTEEGFGDSIFTSHAITVGLIKSWKIGDAHKFTLGAISEPDLAVDPDISVRHEHGLHVGYSVKLTEKLTARLLGRGGYQVSPNSGREDWRYQARASLLYEFTEMLSVGASTAFTWNLSNQDRYDYNNLLAGAYVNLQYRF
ncbi:MAG: hypothetical protein JNJ83_00505 [Verrucomicrobiaceae bacterium]|nr:hypothetical protein [Verrucomicrobiaceae bacterium]